MAQERPRPALRRPSARNGSAGRPGSPHRAQRPRHPHPGGVLPAAIPVAEAGLLIDGQVDARETAATIIDLAVRGALTVQS